MRVKSFISPSREKEHNELNAFFLNKDNTFYHPTYHLYRTLMDLMIVIHPPTERSGCTHVSLAPTKYKCDTEYRRNDVLRLTSNLGI